MPSKATMSPGEEQCYRRGIELWNLGRFFEAHEQWEIAWRTAQGPTRRFLQGLIQFAVALHKAGQGRPAGTVRLFELGRAKWVGLPDVFAGLDLPRFVEQMAGQVNRAVRGEPADGFGAAMGTRATENNY